MNNPKEQQRNWTEDYYSSGAWLEMTLVDYIQMMWPIFKKISKRAEGTPARE